MLGPAKVSRQQRARTLTQAGMCFIFIDEESDVNLRLIPTGIEAA
jgi:hypothetical protein